MKKVLVANARSATSLAVIRSLGSKNFEVTGASISEDDFPLHSKYCHRKIILQAKLEEENHRVDEILGIVKNQHFDVFLPVMTENILRILAKRKNEFEKYTNVPIPTFEMFKCFDDKAETSKLMEANSIPGPRTIILNTDADIDSISKSLTFPVVIKPHRGEGAEGVKVVEDPFALNAIYRKIVSGFGDSLIQEYIPGDKYTAVFVFDNNSIPKRFFVHKAIREYPVSGGPTCCLESVRYDAIFDIGVALLKAVNYFGLASMEFILDERDNVPKIIDVNPRFYGPLQCAITAGADIPFALCSLAMNGGLQEEFSYRQGVRCRNLMFEDTLHLFSIWRGVKTPKNTSGRIRTLINYLKFYQDDSYFILSKSDLKPALKKLYNSLKLSNRLHKSIGKRISL